MFKSVRKRDGRIAEFDRTRITDAIFAAAESVGGTNRMTSIELSIKVIALLKEVAEKDLKDNWQDKIFKIEEIQDIVEKVLIENGHAKVVKAYILYRDKRTRIREAKMELLDIIDDILIETDRDNANISNSPSAKMLQIASAASKKYYLTRAIPEHISEAHINGDIHIHDLDFYGKTLTCLQIPLERLLINGFNNGHGYIRPPKRAASATALAAIILQSSQNDMHGGQSFGFFDKEIAQFFEKCSEHEAYQAMEALVYNLNSMHSRAGAQVPFSSINIGTDTSEAGRKVIRNFLLAYEAGLGHGENPIFPNIIFKIKEGINFNKTDLNYDLFQLAIKVASSRLNPTFSFLDSSFNKEFSGESEVAVMGCRTRVINNVCGPSITNGRGNLSFTSINLPKIALKTKTINKFYLELENVYNIVVEQLLHRFEIQSKLKVKDMPFIMGQKLYLGSENLESNDSIRDAIIHGTLSIGFVGLAEAMKVLTEFYHCENENVLKEAENIISYLNVLCNWSSEKHKLNFTLLATPAESTTGRFLKIDREKFGVIKGVTDKEYYTNSFHVPVNYKINSFDKIRIESRFHKYCNAGAITYVELSSPPINNTNAIESILKYMKETDCGYVGINYPIDFCTSCYYKGVITKNCPNCSSDKISRVRRITGYLSTVDQFNKSKVAELKDRIPHI